MNLNTPLVEVAHLLPAEAAQMIMYEPQNRQNAILHVVRRVVAEWEAKGLALDHFALSIVLTSIVREQLALFHGILNHLDGA